MEDEMNSLISNETWDLVELPEEKHSISNKWVFKVKQNSDGSLDKCKARLVIRGFTQQYGFDCEETFSRY